MGLRVQALYTILQGCYSSTVQVSVYSPLGETQAIVVSGQYHLSVPGYFVVPGFVLAAALVELVSTVIDRLSIIAAEISIIGTGL